MTIDNPSSEYLRLTNENIVKYGFALFHYPHEMALSDGQWNRKIDPGIIESDGEHINNLLIPESFLYPLSVKAEEKLIRKFEFFIREVGKDTDAIKLLSQRAGWNQTIPDLKAYMAIPGTGNFLAGIRVDDSDIPLGSGAVLPVDEKLCWIGMVLVHPEVRRQGIARMLMDRCIDYASNVLKTPVIGLDASEMGLPLYQSQGFTKSLNLWRCLIPAKMYENIESIKQVHPLSNYPELNQYFQKRGFMEKYGLYEKIASLENSINLVFSSDSGIEGFLLSRPGRRYPYAGPLVADSEKIASLLLGKALREWQFKGYEKVFMDIPDNHFEEGGRMDTLLDNRGTNVTFAPAGGHEAGASRQSGEMSILFPRKHKFLKEAEPVRGFARMYLITQGSEEYVLDFMQRERKKWMPYVYSVGGPEWS